MKLARRQRSTRPAPDRELVMLRARLTEAEATLHAIRTGEVDALVVAGKAGPQVFTLEGADHAYRVLIESMHEGALTLTADAAVLYANQCFARMVQCPLERVTGGSFHRFLLAEDQELLRARLKQAGKSGSKIQVLLKASDGSQMPVQISIRSLAKNSSNRATIGMVVTDMTLARHNEELLRTLSQRMVQAQEAERGRVALDLHDRITQLLCAILVRCHTLADRPSSFDVPAKEEAVKLRDMLGQAVEEVERISRNLRPSVLDHLGLVAVLRDTSNEFSKRVGVPVKLVCRQLNQRLPSDTELALYRILQEALKNVEKHAHARHVTVCLKRQGAFVQLLIHDDGIGFHPDRYPARGRGKGGFGLLGMRERAAYVGGALKVNSSPGKGTAIQAQIPLGKSGNSSSAG